MKGKIVLIPFPFTDLSSTKLRPALVLFESEMDIVVAFISSKVPFSPPPGCVVVNTQHPEFIQTGLKVASVIRPDKVCTILKELVIGEIGEIGVQIKEEVNQVIIRCFSFDISG